MQCVRPRRRLRARLVAEVVAVAAVAAQKETKPKQAPEVTDEAKDKVSNKASMTETFPITRSSSHSRRLSPPSRQLSVDLGISRFSNPSIDPFTISQLSATLGQKIMCNDRSAASTRSTSMSGGSPRLSEMKRENRRSWSGLVGSTAVMPRQKQTHELAAEPRPWQRIF